MEILALAPIILGMGVLIWLELHQAVHHLFGIQTSLFSIRESLLAIRRSLLNIEEKQTENER